MRKMEKKKKKEEKEEEEEVSEQGTDLWLWSQYKRWNRKGRRFVS